MCAFYNGAAQNHPDRYLKVEISEQNPRSAESEALGAKTRNQSLFYKLHRSKWLSECQQACVVTRGGIASQEEKCTRASISPLKNQTRQRKLSVLLESRQNDPFISQFFPRTFPYSTRLYQAHERAPTLGRHPAGVFGWEAEMNQTRTFPHNILPGK